MEHRCAASNATEGVACLHVVGDCHVHKNYMLASRDQFKPISFVCLTLTQEMLEVHRESTAIIIDRCDSAYWRQVGKELAGYHQQLLFTECNLPEELFEGLTSSKCLR